MIILLAVAGFLAFALILGLFHRGWTRGGVMYRRRERRFRKFEQEDRKL